MELTRTQLYAHTYRTQRIATWIWSVCVALVVLSFVFGIWLRAVQITDDGMAPALNSGDVIFFDRLSKFSTTPRRGDIVAFQDMNSSIALVGRIIALPGETITITGGEVYINGILLDETIYLSSENPELIEYTVPNQTFFVLPDGRADMIVDAGALSIHADRIMGRAFIRVAPLRRVNVFTR